MEKGNYLLTSESVSEGHPDKICDQISDGVLDAASYADERQRIEADLAALAPAQVPVVPAAARTSWPFALAVMVLATVAIGWAIIIGSSLSFLGLGVQAPTPEWGADLAAGREWVRTAWWMSTFPGLAIMLVILAVNLLGDGLRDALDPRLRNR